MKKVFIISSKEIVNLVSERLKHTGQLKDNERLFGFIPNQEWKFEADEVETLGSPVVINHSDKPHRMIQTGDKDGVGKL